MKVVIFDTETNGLIENHTIKLNKQPEVIEFYGCVVDLAKKGKILSEFDTLVRPHRPLDDEPKKITGLTDEILATAPYFESVANRVELILQSAPVVIAHNLSFDVEMIELEMERLHRKIAWPRKLCTVEQTIHLKGFRLSQSNLHEFLFGEGFEGAHRAKADVHALVRICVELFKMEII